MRRVKNRSKSPGKRRTRIHSDEGSKRILKIVQMVSFGMVYNRLKRSATRDTGRKIYKIPIERPVTGRSVFMHRFQFYDQSRSSRGGEIKPNPCNKRKGVSKMKHFDVFSEIGLRQLGGIFALGATSVSMFTNKLGGWDVTLEFLVVLMILDYITGFVAAVRKKKINSDVMFWGGLRKGGTLLILVVAVYVDEIVNGGSPVFRNMAIFYYIAREGISVFENCAIIGVPVPPFVAEYFAQLKGNTAESPLDKAAKKLAKPGEETEPVSQQIDIVEEVIENKKAE